MFCIFYKLSILHSGHKVRAVHKLEQGVVAAIMSSTTLTVKGYMVALAGKFM